MRFARNAAAAIAVTGLLIGAILVMFPAEAEAAKVFTTSGGTAAVADGSNAVITGEARLVIPANQFVPAETLTISIGKANELNGGKLKTPLNGCVISGPLGGTSGQSAETSSFRLYSTTSADQRQAAFEGTGYVAAKNADGFTLTGSSKGFGAKTGNGFGSDKTLTLTVKYTLHLKENSDCWKAYTTASEYDSTTKLRTMFVQVQVGQTGSEWFMSSVPVAFKARQIGIQTTTAAPDSTAGNAKAVAEVTPANEAGGVASLTARLFTADSTKDSIGSNVKVAMPADAVAKLPSVSKLEFTTKKAQSNTALAIGVNIKTIETDPDIDNKDENLGGLTKTKITASLPGTGSPKVLMQMQISGKQPDGQDADMNEEMSGAEMEFSLPKSAFAGKDPKTFKMNKFDKDGNEKKEHAPKVTYLGEFFGTHYKFKAEFSGFSTFVGYASTVTAETTTTTTTTTSQTQTQTNTATNTGSNTNTGTGNQGNTNTGTGNQGNTNTGTATEDPATKDTDGDGIIDRIDECPEGLRYGPDADQNGCKDVEEARPDVTVTQGPSAGGDNLPTPDSTSGSGELENAGNGPVAIILSIVGVVVLAAIITAVVVVVGRGKDN